MVMYLEIISTANFISFLIRKAFIQSKHSLSESQLSRFRNNLIVILQNEYKTCWYPEKPHYGMNKRYIKIGENSMDYRIQSAWDNSHISISFICKPLAIPKLPILIIMVDPFKVYYHLNYDRSEKILYQYTEGVSIPWKPDMPIIYQKETEDNCCVIQ